MPFEPKLFPKQQEGDPLFDADLLREPGEPAWDDAEALDLPEDLAMLADQLRDDAVYLAERHPADATVAQREAAWLDYVDGHHEPGKQHDEPGKQQCGRGKQRPTRGAPWRWTSAAAAVLLAVATGWTIWQLADGANETSNRVAAPARDGRRAATPEIASDDARRSRDLRAARISAKADGDENRGNSGGAKQPAAEPPRLIPAAFLQDVTGPELDGMLDLLEEDESGLSI